MQYHKELLSLAKHILRQDSTRPSQTALRRAVSSVYYALFHTMAQNGADLLIGKTKRSRSKHAWRQVYRGLEHSSARSACDNGEILKKFPGSIQNFGSFFVKMQYARHNADYDPYATFTKSSVEAYITRAEEAIKSLEGASEKDRRAFCAYVLFKVRKQEAQKF
ncbi:MAG: hypothetical protein OXF24_08180 [Hyphomicrobiales bacterium]|nr:hypothetical protein [Hyphomicrobiales bacterium]